MPKKNFLDISVSIVECELANEETSHSMSFSTRCTASRNVDDEQFFHFDFVDEKNPSKGFKEKKSFVSIGDSHTFEPDDRVYIEMYTYTFNSELTLSPTRSGQAFVSMKDMKKSIEAGQKEISLDYFMFNIDQNENEDEDEENDNIPLKKGTMLVKIKDTKQIQKWNFKELNQTHYVEENIEIFSGALKRHEEQQEKMLGMKCIPEVANVALPFYRDNVSVAGKQYFVEYDSGETVEHQENFFIQSINVALMRNQKDEKWLNAQIETFKISKKFTYETKLLCNVIGTAISIPSTSRPYKSDETYVGREKIQTEEFSLPERIDHLGIGADDCEGTGSDNYRRANKIRRLNFSSKTMNNVKWFMNRYVVFGALATVNGAQISDVNGNPVEVIIGDKNDNEIKKKAGGHVFAIAIPRTRVAKMITKNNIFPQENKEKFIQTIQGQDDHSDQLPSMIFEGTGDVEPLLFADQCYFKDNETRKFAYKEHRKKVETYKSLSKMQSFSIGSISRTNMWVYDKPGKTFSFYRKISSLYTDEWDREIGTEFIVANQISDQQVRGVDLRYLIFDDKKDGNPSEEKYYQKPVLLPMPSPSESDKKLLISLKRQLPFSASQRITDVGLKKVGEPFTKSGVSRSQTLEKFVSTANELCKDRVSDQNSEVTHVVTFKYDNFFDTALEFENSGEKVPISQALLSDIGENQAITGLGAMILPISDFTNVVDIHVRMNSSVCINESKTNMNNIGLDSERNRGKQGNALSLSSINSLIKQKIEKDEHFPLVFETKLESVGCHMSDFFPSDFNKIMRFFVMFTNSSLKLLSIGQKGSYVSPEVKYSFGFRGIFNILERPRVRESLQYFIRSNRRRAFIAPWIDLKNAAAFYDATTFSLDKKGVFLDNKTLTNILLDHMFFWDEAFSQSNRKTDTSMEFQTLGWPKKTVNIDMENNYFPQDIVNGKLNFRGTAKLVDPKTNKILDKTQIAYIAKFGEIDLFASNSIFIV